MVNVINDNINIIKNLSNTRGKLSMKLPLYFLILGKVYDTCFIMTSEKVSMKLLFPLGNKSMIYNLVSKLKKDGMLRTEKFHKKIFIVLTDKGSSIARNVSNIEILIKEKN